MSLEENLYTLLQAQCPRVFPDVAPLSTPRPYITYQQIGGDDLAFVDDTLPNTRSPEVQINYWADTRTAAKALALQTRDALMVSPAMQARPIGGIVDDFDDDMQRYGSRQDFSIWASGAT